MRKKKPTKDADSNFFRLSKLLLVMNLSLLCMLVFSAQVFSSPTYSETKKLNLQFNNATVQEVIAEIENQSEFEFFFNHELLVQNQRKVDLNVENETIHKVLNQLFDSQEVSYKINDRHIIIVPLEKESKKVDKPQSNDPKLKLQQQIEVSGTVTDAQTGEPLPGVNIVIQGTTQGATTNMDGNYSIEAPDDATLVFSFVGYQEQTIEIESRQEINITLQQSVTQMEEVVAIGYGTQKRSNLTSSISSVESDQIEEVSVSDMTNTLTGRTPGVRVLQYSSRPGAYDTDIDIRGFGDPLFIIDGVKRDKAAFSRLNPKDIKNLSVLKDASAAVYGIQAANGVVLVTTKDGAAQEELTVNYSGKFGMQQITQYPDLSNAYMYALMRNEQFINSEIQAGYDQGSPKYREEQVEAYKNGELPSTDFLDLVLEDQAPQQQHNLSFRGGGEKVNFYVSAGFFEEQGLWITDDLWANKYNVRANLEAKLTENLTFTSKTGLVKTRNNSQTMSEYWLIRMAMRTPPHNRVYANGNSDYLAEPSTSEENPRALIDNDISGFERQDEWRLSPTFTLDYEIPFVEGLSAEALYSHQVINGRNRFFQKEFAQYSYEDATESFIEENRYNSPSDLDEDTWDNIDKTYQVSLRYDNSFGNHNIESLILYEANEQINRYNSAFTEYAIDVTPELDAGEAGTALVSGNKNEFANQSWVGRLNYDYSEKYLFQFSFRYDGSSLYPEGSRWGFFPSASAGWRISEEPFFNVPIVDNLKIRASYGVLGDDSGADLVNHRIGYNYPSGGYVFGDVFTSGLGIQNSVNPDFTWYTSTTSDIGLEGSFWDGALSFNFDVFRRDREGLPGRRIATIPATYGVALPQENLNEDRQQGFEIELTHQNRLSEDFSYSISPNISYTRSQWRYYEESPARNSYDAWRYKNANRYKHVSFGYESIGQFESFEEAHSSPIHYGSGNTAVLPGDVKNKDINKDGLVNFWDQRPIARAGVKPTIYYGVNLSVNWHNFDASMLIQGAANYKVRYRDQLSRPFFWGYANPISEFQDRWHRTDYMDPNSEWVSGKYPALNANSWGQNSTFWWRNANYVRLKNIEIGYTLPESVLETLNMNRLRIFANGFNVLTFSKGLDFVDPEHTDDRNWGYVYPLTLNVNFGVELSF